MRLFHLVALLPLIPLGALTSHSSFAAVTQCASGVLLEQSFDSGASWSLCADVDEQHALDIQSVHYRAPGDRSRSVLQRAHVAQILMHYHDEQAERAQIAADSVRTRLLAMNGQTCNGTAIQINGTEPQLCSRLNDRRVLAKYAQRPALQGQSWELYAAMQAEELIWTTAITFTEDGQIRPSVTLSGRARQVLASEAFSSTLAVENRFLARATVLSSWRMVFNLDDGEPDTVQQFDFGLVASRGNRRPMQVNELNTEVFTTVDRERFRGWRIADATGTGYYLDPSNSGFNYLGSAHNWARFDVALTRFDACEKHALNNTATSNELPACGSSLDDFVNGENLQGAHPVLWFSQSRTLDPGNEDWPVISNFSQSFVLLPYDWTPASPFEVIE